MNWDLWLCAFLKKKAHICQWEKKHELVHRPEKYFEIGNLNILANIS
jgi:hypothetical protein